MISTLPSLARKPSPRPREPGVALLPLIELVAAWGERRRQRRALLQLDAHLLKDIGIAPGEAWHEGVKPFWKA